MNDTQLKQLLKQADATDHLGLLNVSELSKTVQGRLRRQKQRTRCGIIAVTILILIGVFSVPQYQSYRKQQRIARLQQDVRELSRQTEETLALLQTMLLQQQQQDALDTANRRLAKYENTIRREVEEAAFLLLYQADRMADTYNDQETAIEFYQQIVERFGDTPSAKTAQERLTDIQNQNQSTRI